MHKRTIPLRQMAPQLVDQHRFAAAGCAAQQSSAASVLNRIAQLQHRPLMAFAGVIAADVRDILERPPIKLPVCFVH